MLIQIVLEYFRRIQRECRSSDVTFPVLERAAHEELTSILSAWLKQEQLGTTPWRVPVDTMANIMSMDDNHCPAYRLNSMAVYQDS